MKKEHFYKAVHMKSEYTVSSPKAILKSAFSSYILKKL